MAGEEAGHTYLVGDQYAIRPVLQLGLVLNRKDLVGLAQHTLQCHDLHTVQYR